MITVFDPTFEKITKLDPAVQRHWMPPLETLKPVRLGLLANGKEQAEELLEHVREGLEEREGVEFSSVVRHAKRDVTTPPRPEVFEDLVENCDVIITAIGN